MPVAPVLLLGGPVQAVLGARARLARARPTGRERERGREGKREREREGKGRERERQERQERQESQDRREREEKERGQGHRDGSGSSGGLRASCAVQSHVGSVVVVVVRVASASSQPLSSTEQPEQTSCQLSGAQPNTVCASFLLLLRHRLVLGQVGRQAVRAQHQGQFLPLDCMARARIKGSTATLSLSLYIYIYIHMYMHSKPI